MFYLFAVGSMIGYTAQSLLMVRYCRRMNALDTAMYRGLSFIVTLAPFLYLGSAADLADVGKYYGQLILAGFAGSLSLTLAYSALSYLPIGISGSLNKACVTIAILLIGMIFLQESISGKSILFIGIIVAGSVVMSLQKSHHAHLRSDRWRGVILSALASIPFAITISIFSSLSRTYNPWIVGYFWEVSIGVCALTIVIIRWALFKVSPTKVSRREFSLLALCASPTLIGTGLFGLATEIGPVSIASSIGNASLVVSPLLAWMFYKEPLSRVQWLSIVIVLVGVVGLRFA